MFSRWFHYVLEFGKVLTSTGRIRFLHVGAYILFIYNSIKKHSSKYFLWKSQIKNINWWHIFPLNYKSTHKSFSSFFPKQDKMVRVSNNHVVLKIQDLSSKYHSGPLLADCFMLISWNLSESLRIGNYFLYRKPSDKSYWHFNSLLLQSDVLIFVKEVYLYRNDGPTFMDIITDNKYDAQPPDKPNRNCGGRSKWLAKRRQAKIISSYGSER